MTDLDLRRAGLCARQPARRRLLALQLQDMPVEALQWICGQATGADAATTIEGWLSDGSWRERWDTERRRRDVAVVDAMDQDRLEGLVQARVFGDRRSVDAVAIEFGLTRDEAEAIVMRGGIARGLGDAEIARILQPRRSKRVTSASPAAGPKVEEQQPAVARTQLDEWYAGAGRRAPSNVVAALCERGGATCS